VNALTGKVEFDLSGYPCQLNRSMQHFVEVYSLEFGILKFFWDADLTAAPLGPDPLAYSRTGQFSQESIVVIAHSGFRSCRPAMNFADHRIEFHIRGHCKGFVLG
jgi:hypothetical protein